MCITTLAILLTPRPKTYVKTVNFISVRIANLWPTYNVVQLKEKAEPHVKTKLSRTFVKIGSNW